MSNEIVPLPAAAADLVMNVTRDGFRVHRFNCKRQGDAVPLASAIDFAPGNVLKAQAASCCKPKGLVAVIDYIKENGGSVEEPPLAIGTKMYEISSERKNAARQEANRAVDEVVVEAAKAKKEQPEEQPEEQIVFDESVADDPAFDGANHASAESFSKEVRYDGPKHFWPYLAVNGGQAWAESHGLALSPDRKEWVIVFTGDKALVEKAVAEMPFVWAGALGALKGYKKTEEGRPSKGSTKAKQAVYLLWYDFLTDFTHAAAYLDAGEPVTEDSPGTRAAGAGETHDLI